MVYKVEIGEDNVPFVQQGKYRLRLDLEEIEDGYKERAIKELREDPETVSQAIERYRELIKGEQNLYVPLEDDAFLVKFLRPCKYYPESAFKLLKKFYKFKIKHPDFGLNLTPERIRHVFDNEVFVFLPTRSASGARIMLINIGAKWNTKIVSLTDMFRATIVALEIAMLEPKTQVGGVHVILSFDGLSLSHIAQFTPSIAKTILDWVQECTPVRLKGIHIVNQPYIFNMLYAIFKPFIGAKIKRRLYFHGTNLNSLVEKISAGSLPDYLGGTADIPDVPGHLFSDMLFFYKDQFDLYNSFGYKTQKKSDKVNGKSDITLSSSEKCIIQD